MDVYFHKIEIDTETRYTLYKNLSELAIQEWDKYLVREAKKDKLLRASF